MISVVYGTRRPGGYDMLASSLSPQTFRNFEVICVDDWPHRDMELAKVYLEHAGVPQVQIARSKTKCFPQLPYQTTNAWNTGFILSRGDIVLLLTDLCWLPPDFLQRVHYHAAKLAAGQLIVMPGHFWGKEDTRNLQAQISLWEKPWSGPPEANGCQYLFSWVPEGFELACTALPMHILREINGFPEWVDGYGNPPQDPIREAVIAAGGGWYVDEENYAHFVNHREWEPAELWHNSKRPDKPLVAPGTPNTFNLRRHEKE